MNSQYLVTILSCLLIGLILIACEPQAGEPIVFASNRDGPFYEIYTMEPDGSDVNRLTFYESSAENPAWSPTGEFIAFASLHGGNRQIYVMQRDGTNEVQLTEGSGGWQDPDWSPDGTRIVCEATLDGDREIYAVEVKGGQVVQLTHNTTQDFDPSWSPNGENIIFVCKHNTGYEICVLELEGGTVRRLTNTPAIHHSPAWSPDGTRVAFLSNLWALEAHFSLRYAQCEVYVMNADGTDVIRLTEDPAGPPCYATQLTWSPDGRHIAYTCRGEREFEICVIPSGGGPVTQLTDGWERNISPDWSP